MITFSDPASRNAFSFRAAEELWSTIENNYNQNLFDGLLFRAEGRVFCSGGQLSDYATMMEAGGVRVPAAANGPELGRQVNRRISEILERLALLEKPTVCLITGDCFGGGLELMSAFDGVLAAPHAMFGFWQRKIGLSFGWGGGHRLQERLGSKRTRQLALAAATVPASEALALGLVDAVHPEPLLDAAGEAWLRRWMNLPRAPVGPLKSWDVTREREPHQREREIFEELWGNEEHRETLKLKLKERRRK